LAQIRTKSFSGWGFAVDPSGGVHSAPRDSLAGKGRGKEGKREGEQEGGE